MHRLATIHNVTERQTTDDDEPLYTISATVSTVG